MVSDKALGHRRRFQREFESMLKVDIRPDIERFAKRFEIVEYLVNTQRVDIGQPAWVAERKPSEDGHRIRRQKFEIAVAASEADQIGFNHLAADHRRGNLQLCIHLGTVSHFRFLAGIRMPLPRREFQTDSPLLPHAPRSKPHS